jgi:DNA-binding GntR family transcriptional regulator
VATAQTGQRDAYDLLIAAIDEGAFRPGDRLVESEIADRFGMSRTPIREALQRLETHGVLARDGRSLVVSTLDHDQLGELYVVRAELEGLAARLAAQHAAAEEVRVLWEMVRKDGGIVDQPALLARSNKRFHRQLHLASHNRYLVQQLEMVHRTMALVANTSLAVEGRGRESLEEHGAIVRAIEARDGDGAEAAIRAHISRAFEARLLRDAEAWPR